MRPSCWRDLMAQGARCNLFRIDSASRIARDVVGARYLMSDEGRVAYARRTGTSQGTSIPQLPSERASERDTERQRHGYFANVVRQGQETTETIGRDRESARKRERQRKRARVRRDRRRLMQVLGIVHTHTFAFFPTPHLFLCLFLLLWDISLTTLP